MTLDKLEHAQHEHWIQLGLMAALTIANAAQLGADPVTDAAEVGAGAGMEVAAGLSLSGLGNLALDGALTGFGSDVFSQLGADLLDWTDPQFDETGDDVVPLFDRGRLRRAPSRGRSPGSTTVSGGGLGREGRSASSPTTASKPTRGSRSTGGLSEPGRHAGVAAGLPGPQPRPGPCCYRWHSCL